MKISLQAYKPKYYEVHEGLMGAIGNVFGDIIGQAHVFVTYCKFFQLEES